jgi:SAM-dependent methyltransferase
MKFKYKCYLQNLFSNIPGGEILNYFFQKYVTRSLPVSNDSFLDKVRFSYDHYLKFMNLNSLYENSHKYYEFGAGWDLTTSIAMGLLGFEVTCIDIRKLVFNQLITDTITKFNNNIEHIPFPVSQLDLKHERNQLNYLKNKFNLNYIAPLDARNTKFNHDYFDLAASTVTFEHIPAQDLYLILNETYKILKRGGIFSLIIDYRDHWSYFDKSISIYNFLIYSDKEWEKFNPSLHYQNRLRHKDYLNIISKTKFKIMEDVPELPSRDEIIALENLKINNKYMEYSIIELGVKSSQIVLKK